MIHFGKTYLHRVNREETAIDHALTNKPESIKDHKKIELNTQIMTLSMWI